MRRFCLLICFCLPFQLWSQSWILADTSLLPNNPFQFQVNSTWSQSNARSLLTDYFPYNGPDFTNFCSVYYPYRQLLQSFSIQNEHNAQLHNVGFSFNGENNYQTDSLIARLSANLNSNKAKALSFYRYVADNHLYYYAPDNVDPIRENYNASKFLNVYGYGHCGMIATGLSHLAHRYTGQDQRFWYIDGGYHGLSEIKIDSTYVCLDADQEGYYLLPDNTTLATFRDVYLDKYLYLRTKHFGRAAPFNWQWNRHFNHSISNGFHFINHTDSLLNINEPCCPRINTLAGSDQTFNLPANSSVTFFPQDTCFTSHFVQNAPAPDLTTVLQNIGRGTLITDFSPFGDTISQAFSQHSNVMVPAGDTVYTAFQANTICDLVFKQESPFVLHSGTFRISFYKHSTEDSINIYFSKDSINWTPLLLNAAVAPGQHAYQINLLNYIQPNSTGPTYQCFVHIQFISDSNSNGILIKELANSLDFQFNKLTGPALRPGVNTLRLHHSDSVSLRTKLRWQQDSLNHPPSSAISPLFPQNNSLIDSNFFTFKWTVPSDPDGHNIVDYQFMVSETPDMTYPIAGLYDRGLFLTNGGQPFFTPEIKDYLTPYKTYYWRVRAQDAPGLWGSWSPVWSFSVRGTAYPKNLHWEFAPNQATDIIKLVWDGNPNGDSAHHFLVYAANERNGFFPADSTLQNTTLVAEQLVHLSNAKTKHRVVAVDQKGNISSASYMVNLPMFITGNIGTTFDYIQSILAHLELLYEPWPTVNVTDRELFCLVDNSKLYKSGTLLVPVDTGYTKADICTLIGQDTVYVFQLFVRILPAGFTAPYHEAPGLLITPGDTTVTAQNGLTINTLRYDGFIDGDTVNDLASSASVIHGITSNTTPGLYNTFATGAISSKYRIVYQPGIIKVLTSTSLVTHKYSIQIIASPNPFTDGFTIAIQPSQPNKKYSVTLFDIQGRIAAQVDDYRPGETILSGQLRNGVYIMQVGDEDGKPLEQMIIMKN